jgi:hypothetical protein
MAHGISTWIASAVVASFLCLLPAIAEPNVQEKEETAIESEASQDLPPTRAERLKRQREDKAGKIVTPTQNIVEKYAKSFDKKGSNSVEDVNFWGFHPRLDWIARGSGVAPGVRYWKPEVLGPIDLMGAAFYSWRRYQHYDLNIGMIPNRGKRIPSRSFETEGIEQLGDIDRGKFSRFKLYASGRYRDRTDESFYGAGPDSKKEDRARYRVKDTLFEAVTGVQLTSRIGFTFKAGYLQHSLAKGRSDPSLWDNFPIVPLPDPELPGRVNPPNYWRYHTSFLLDFRDDPGVPHKGFMVAFGWEKFDNVNTRNFFNFNRFSIGARGYIPLGSHQRVLALRAVGVNSDAASGNRVPFFLQPSLGGGESLRGYDPFRFQGDKMILLQGEYRWEASRRIELAFFGDTGTVANQGERLSINKMKSDAGIGFRFKSSRATLFRFDLARSNEGFKAQFRFSASF